MASQVQKLLCHLCYKLTRLNDSHPVNRPVAAVMEKAVSHKHVSLLFAMSIATWRSCIWYCSWICLSICNLLLNKYDLFCKTFRVGCTDQLLEWWCTSTLCDQHVMRCNWHIFTSCLNIGILYTFNIIINSKFHHHQMFSSF